MSNFYDEMMTRNWAFINQEEQKKIKNTKILLAGCGLGSNVAELAVEIGFTKFVLVDGDKVEVSNLNRQSFDRRHVGQNKAEALKQILEEKSEAVEVEVYPEMITSEIAGSYVDKADVIVNTVDFNETMYEINKNANDQDKPVFFPMNIGWGGFCLVFIKDSPSLEQMLGGKVIDDDAKFLRNLFIGLKEFKLPDYLVMRLDNLQEVINNSDKGSPQLAIASFRSASIVVESIVKYIIGQELKSAPVAITLDAFEGGSK